VAYLHLGDGMTPGLSVQACYDMLTVQRGLVGLEEADLPHYNTVRNFLAAITPALKVYATRGRKEYAERMLPYLSRAHSEPANSIWVSDTMVSDVEVLNDIYSGTKLGAPVRLRLTAIIDYRSRYLVGYSWAWEGSSQSIASALRMAISHHGPCELFYVDNGKDFVKVAAGALPGYVQPGDIEGWFASEMRRIDQTGILARLGIRVTHCIPHHPQSKHIERFFRTLHLTFCKYWHTYTGGKPSERPDNTAALMMHHRRMLAAGTIEKSHHPLASDFIRTFEAWVEKYHAHRGHRGQGMNFRSPAEVFDQERNPKQKPKPDAEALAWLLWDHKRPVVHECQVRVNNHDYAPVNEVQAQRMFELNEQKVTVAFDPLDPSMVAVLDEDNRLITTLEAKRLVRMAPDDPETQRQIAAISQMRGSLTRTVREQRTSLIRTGKEIGVLHPIKLLASSAEAGMTLPSTIDIADAAASRITPRKPRPEDEEQRAPMYANDLGAKMFRRLQERKK
jgi:transposase InsO family protein